MDEKLLAIINDIRADKDQPALDRLDDEMSLRRNLGFDSMDLAMLTAHLHDKFGVDIFSSGIVDSIREVKLILVGKNVLD